ncbi:hypothetical protein IJ384_01015 [bacterium]|nr:hypothetical protein [bacterium]
MVVIACEKYSKTSAYEISLVNPRTTFSILPKASFSANEFLIKSKKDSLVTKIEGAKITLRLLPLLSGKFHINSISINSINMKANLIESLELDKDFLDKLKKVQLSINSITIGEFEALFYQDDVVKPIIYKGVGFNYQRKNQYVKVQNNSTLNVDGNVSKVVSNLYLPKNNDIKNTIFDMEISNVDIAPLQSYFKHYLPKDLKKLQGIVDIKAGKEGFVAELKDCAVLKVDDAKSIIFPQKMFLKSKFVINRNYIDFENIDLESEKIHLSANGRLMDYFGKTMPTLDFSVRINKSSIADVINLLPPFEIEELDVYKLKKYKFYGGVLANFSIKGRLPEPDAVGDIYIDDGVLVKPISQNTKGATIKLHLTGRHVDFDVVVPTGGIEKVYVKGSQELYNIKYADLIVKSTDSVDLKIAQNVLIPLHEILNFILGPVPIMDLSGYGNIDITVKGNRKNPHIWGVFNVKNAGASFNELKDLKVNNINAVLKFNDQASTFQSDSAFLNNNKIFIQGICDLFGKFDFDISSENQPVNLLYEALKKSTFLPQDKIKMLVIDNLDGVVDFKIKVHGVIKDFYNIKFNENLFAKGKIIVKNNSFDFDNISIQKTNGNINFDNNTADADIVAAIGDLPLAINAKIKDLYSDVVLDIPKLNPNFLISDIETRNKQYLPYLSLKGKYNGRVDKIDYDKLNIKATILDSISQSKIKYNKGGIIQIVGNKLSFKNIRGFVDNPQNLFELNLIIDNAFKKNITTSGSVKFKSPDLSLYNDVLKSDILPKSLKQYVKDYEFKKGALNLDIKLADNKIYSSTDLSGINFVYLPLEMPIEIINGNIDVKNNQLKLNKINLLADNMPILIDGDIKDLFEKQNFNLYFNSKPEQDFIDKYINKNQLYPIKIKGDIVYWLKIKGTPENYDMKAQIDMSKDSSIYYFGATVGDVENAISVSISSKIIDKLFHKIKEFSYDKVISSQSGRQTKMNLLKAYGGVKILEEDLIFDDLFIKTSNPTDARIFNIIFRKPNIKQGQFTSDLKFNGKLSSPKIIGDFHIFETNIPFLDTSMENIELVFKEKTIDFNTRGEVIGNDIIFDGVLKNKLTPPYKIERANFYTKQLDLNQIINKLKTAEVENARTFESFEGFDLDLVVANDFKLKADNVILRNIHATDFEAITSLSEKRNFDVNDFKFNIANGELHGKYSYNLKNNDMNISLRANSINANDITWALFDLNNQIYGDLTGDVTLSCNGSDFNRCMETLNGNTIFNVKEGKMPKLGSLEYLLKAGNLVKGGFTGLSINSVIDLLAPSKTGDFSDIFGSVRIKDGVARNIEITTKGDDLNLFIAGTYNFATSIADMEVLGLLSRKISTMFGPIGNMSINTLFNVIPGVDLTKDSPLLERINKIPGIELSNKAYRKFIADIKGNINGDDYVTSFKWIN